MTITERIYHTIVQGLWQREFLYNRVSYSESRSKVLSRRKNYEDLLYKKYKSNIQ